MVDITSMMHLMGLCWTLGGYEFKAAQGMWASL